MALMVVPVLFHFQADRSLAGILAGHLFRLEVYLGLGVAALALLLPGRTKFLWGYAAVALLALMQWVVAPQMADARLHGIAWGLGFGAWHGIAAVLYGGACLAALLLVWDYDFR